MFTGPFQSQIDALAKRLVAIENPRSTSDQNEYQFQRQPPVDNSLISTLQQSQTQAQAKSTLSKVDPGFTVVFAEISKANKNVAASDFYFEAGFVVFIKNDSNVAAYPAHEISHITKL